MTEGLIRGRDRARWGGARSTASSLPAVAASTSRPLTTIAGAAEMPSERQSAAWCGATTVFTPAMRFAVSATEKASGTALASSSGVRASPASAAACSRASSRRAAPKSCVVWSSFSHAAKPTRERCAAYGGVSETAIRRERGPERRGRRGGGCGRLLLPQVLHRRAGVPVLGGALPTGRPSPQLQQAEPDAPARRRLRRLHRRGGEGDVRRLGQVEHQQLGDGVQHLLQVASAVAAVAAVASAVLLVAILISATIRVHILLRRRRRRNGRRSLRRRRGRRGRRREPRDRAEVGRRLEAGHHHLVDWLQQRLR